MSPIHSEPFAQVPEWVIDADISDRAVRLFAVLVRYGGKDSRAFPGRKRIAERLRASVDSVDRATAELVEMGALTIQKEYRDDGSQTANSYWLWPATPGRTGPHRHNPPAAPLRPGGGNGAAPSKESQRKESQRKETEPLSLSTREPLDPRSDPAYGFEKAWERYPRRKGLRVGKAKALVRWRDLSYDEKAVAYERLANYRIAADREQILAKDMSAWLHERLWEDPQWADPPPMPPAVRGSKTERVEADLHRIDEWAKSERSPLPDFIETTTTDQKALNR